MRGPVYETEFETLLEKISDLPNGDKLLDLSGISAQKTDIGRYTDDFIGRKNSNVADLSVDSNSNIKQRSVITYINEAPKGMFRLNNYHLLWKFLKEKHGIDRANEAVKADITGDIYIADFQSFPLPYCYAFSAMDILEKGMPFIVSPHSRPAVHLDTFIQHIIQSTMYFSNSLAGAVAFPDFFPAIWFTYQYDKSIGYPTSDPVLFDKWVTQQFQLFVYTINQPYRSGTQSPFVNISVYDKYFMEDMFGGLSWINPKTGEFVDINLEEVDKLQKQFSEWFVKESKIQIFTFPVMTACNITETDENGKRCIKDEEFFRWVAEINRDRALFNCYIGEQGKLSSCLTGDEELMLNLETGEKITFEQLWNTYSENPEKVGYTKLNMELRVPAYDEYSQVITESKVTRLLRRKADTLLKIKLQTPSGEHYQFTADINHQVWTWNRSTISAGTLKIKDIVPIYLQGNDKDLEAGIVVKIEKINVTETYVYDIEMEDYHLFFLGSGIITHNCCRLRNDSSKMKEFFNSLGSGGVKIGSHRVVTINLPRIAHNSSSLDDFISKLEKKMELARDILKVHREFLKLEIQQGLLPLYTLGFMDLKTQFSTVGLIGIYEALDILGYDITEDKNMKYIKQVVNVMNDKNDRFSAEDGVLYNLEQIPGESAAVKLAQKDKYLYNMDYEMYSNQFIPLVKNVPLAKRIKVQGLLDSSMSGGSILHINIAEKITSTEMLLTLMNYAVENNVVYFAPNYNIAVCPEGHITVGKVKKCSVCGDIIDHNLTRVVGFFTKTSDWIKERRGKTDYESRIFY